MRTMHSGTHTQSNIEGFFGLGEEQSHVREFSYDTDHPEIYATQIAESPALRLDLANGKIRTIVWATGYRPDHSWLDAPVLDRKDRLVQEGRIVNAPGMYALGLPMMRRRKSSFIHGVEDDARELMMHLADYLRRPVSGNDRLEFEQDSRYANVAV